MAHELVPREGSEVEPYAGHVPEWYVPPVVTARPTWSELHVPYNPESNIGRWYHHIVLPFRAMAIGFLWVTHPDNLVPVLFCIATLLGVILFLVLK